MPSGWTPSTVCRLSRLIHRNSRLLCRYIERGREKIESNKLVFTFLQKSTALLKERKETASILTADMAKHEKEEYMRQIADHKEYIEKVEEEKRFLEADLDHLANELEKFRERGTNYHGIYILFIFYWVTINSLTDEEILYLQSEKEKLDREIRYMETDLDRCKDSLSREKQAYTDLQEVMYTIPLLLCPRIDFLFSSL